MVVSIKEMEDRIKALEDRVIALESFASNAGPVIRRHIPIGGNQNASNYKI